MESFLKRKNDQNGSSSKRSKQEDCPHGIRCFRRNPHHFKEFGHSHLDELLEQPADSIQIPAEFPQAEKVYLEQLHILRPLRKSSADLNSGYKIESTPSGSKIKNEVKCEMKTVIPIISNNNKQSECGPSGSEINTNKIKAKQGTMLDKLNKASPYNLFFTTIPKSPETLKQFNSVIFTDLLCPSLGELKCSLQINFMIDIGWLQEQYVARSLGKKPLTILYGDDSFTGMKEYMDKFLPNVTHHYIKMKDPFGCHHSKIGIYIYSDDSLRVVVSTANLYYEDWNHYNQGYRLWMSPACAKLPESSGDKEGESPTGFKKALVDYLEHYKLVVLADWVKCVKRADFSAVRVFLVTSVPGKHYPKNNGSHVHHVADLLSRHCALPVKTTPQTEGPLSWGIVAQASSLGSMGKSPSDWLRSTLLRSLSAHNKTHLVSNSSATLNLIFPTVNNVLGGYFGPESGGCLPYSKATNEKQKWLQEYLHQWKADGTHRSRAMPHIKSYCRVSPCLTKLAWFLLTSSNISKSAWGGNIQKDSSVYVRSCEAGVMFLPKFFNEEYFEIARTVASRNTKVFPFMYDLPLTPYKTSDYPWCN